MTPDPDARSVVTRSAVLGTSPSRAAYDVAKISTTVGLTSRVVASSEPLSSAAVFTARDRVCAEAPPPPVASRSRLTIANAATALFIASCRLPSAVRVILSRYFFSSLLNAGSRHGNPIQVALHTLAREGVCISSPAGHHIR